MRAISIPTELIRQSEDTGAAQARFTLSAPASGVVAELGVREGVAVAPGMTLFRIAGLDKVWGPFDFSAESDGSCLPGERGLARGLLQ